jgi:hypothetical protein
MDCLPSLMVSILDFYRESKMTLQEAFAEVRDTRRGPAVGYISSGPVTGAGFADTGGHTSASGDCSSGDSGGGGGGSCGGD